MVNTPEIKVGLIATSVVVGVALWRMIDWFFSGPKEPDPWGTEIEEHLNDPDVLPVCHHCSVPHPETAWFCPECGAAVGDYNNWNPYLYIFSLGEVLRAGTFGKPQRSWVTALGYFILSAGEYVVFAPVYWVLFLSNYCAPLHQPTRPSALPPSPSGSA